MTREEAIKELNTFKIGAKSELGENALDIAIKALKQEPCEDAISRFEVFEALNSINGGAELDKVFEAIENLPPVKPVACIAKVTFDKDDMQELVDKRVEELVTRKKGKWIFTKTVFDKHGCTVECSSCHKKWKTYEEIRWKKENKFCPNCGSLMTEMQGVEE